jgi:hypothetical protein
MVSLKPNPNTTSGSLKGACRRISSNEAHGRTVNVPGFTTYFRLVLSRIGLPALGKAQFTS